MKFMTRHGVLLVAVAVITATLTGCPLIGGPRLSVQPGTLSLSESKPGERISVTNDGSGTLNWTAQTSVAWLLLSYEGETPKTIVSGSTRVVSLLQIHLVKSALPENADKISTEIVFKSNGGNTVVPVTLSRPSTPVLGVSPESVNFGEEETEQLVEVLNEGDAVLQWQASLPQGLDWVTVTPTSGSVSRLSAQGISVKINRAKLVPASTPYRAEIEIDSNGGKKILPITAEAPAFVVSPSVLDFEVLRQPETRALAIRTSSNSPVSITTTVSYVTGDGWLTRTPATATISNARSEDVLVTANPAGLDVGGYEAIITLTHAETGRVVRVPVSMAAALPVDFQVTPDAIAFGDARDPVSATATLVNEGDEPIEWRVEKTASAPWLSVAPDSGVLEEAFEVTIAANPALLQPGPANATLMFFAGGNSRMLRVTLNRLPDLIPDNLEVEPRERDFGALLNRLELTLWNEGPSRINWSIDGASLPEWLNAAPLSGSVQGAITQVVQLTLDRNLAPDEEFFAHTLVITPSGVDLPPVEVMVRAQQRRFPEIVVIGEGVDAANIPFILIDIGQDSKTFVIRNEGNADLNWEISREDLPAWISSISPLQGILQPGRERTVRVTTNRSGLTQSGGSHRLPILSNDPDTPKTFLDVQVRVPFSIVIAVNPTELNFGRTLSTLPFGVANVGDLGRQLDFVVTTNQPEWVFIEPERGRCISTTPISWQQVSVAIDRSRIKGTGAVAKLIVSAENVPANAAPVTPVEVPISVDAAELTIQTAFPRYRPPSLLRFNMLFRDSGLRVFPDLLDNPLDAQTLYRLNSVRAQILEDSNPLDLSETNIIIKKDETLSFSVMLMLDFSASMLEAAQALVLDGQLDPGSLNPLEALYLETIGPMIQEFPAHYRVALAVFNERRPGWEADTRIITGAPVGYPLKETLSTFSSDKAVLQHRLQNMDVQDYGATPLYSAVASGALQLFSLDNTLPDFDAMANRIIVLITDGRRTTPPGDLTALLDLLEATRTRVFPIGWGRNVLANPLIQMSTRSGGHYYATQSKLVPGAVDSLGNPLSIPLKSSLLDRCRFNPSASDPSSVPRDLGAHVVMSYVTLNQEDSTRVQARMEVDLVTPSVKETIEFDQVPMSLIANDVRLGQIGMRTQGIAANGSAQVRFYMDYAPRNIKRMVFNIETDPVQSWQASVTPLAQGGLVVPPDWGLLRIGNQITVQTTTDRALTYGDYGNLFDINVTGATEPFDLIVTVVEPLITPHPDAKYLTIPERIRVGFEPREALSFPNPEFEFTPPAESELSNVYNLGNLGDLAPEDRNLEVLISNIGGEHLPTLATMYWKVEVIPGYLPGTRPGGVDVTYNGPEPIDTDFYLIHAADTAFLAPSGVYDEFDVVIADPDIYSVLFYIVVNYGTLGYEFYHGPYYLVYEVPAP